MKPTDTLTTLFSHNLWANLLLLERCAELTDEQLEATIPGAFGSIHDTLQHIVLAEQSYFLRISTAFQMISASDRFKKTTNRVDEMWQTDFTQFKVVSWGWYYLCTVLDDYSRYIFSWRLSTTMAATDVEETLQMALDKSDITRVKVKHRPRLLSDNGPCFVSRALAKYLKRYRLTHVRSAPYHPMTQGKIERFHHSMTNVVKLDMFYFPWDLEQAVAKFVDYYNHERYHGSLDNLTPADAYFGRAEEVQNKREEIK